MKNSYYTETFLSFATRPQEEVLGHLTAAHHFKLEEGQRDAWRSEIGILKAELAGIQEGVLHFEFIIPRLGKRADCVLIHNGIVFVLEFKVGAYAFDGYGITQVHDYALDLKNFHLGSHAAQIVPVLIATKAKPGKIDFDYAADGVAKPLQINADQIREVLQKATLLPEFSAIENSTWCNSGYRPTPTIIEAARSLYATHQVNTISSFDAGAQNLEATHTYIASVIENAKMQERKAICFITGVPGAGKTLAGLNIATHRAEHPEEHAVFLSGNGPLVAVLREALARDQTLREGIKKADAARRVSAFIQNIHHFRDEYIRDRQAPVEKVVVFDEAQRAWTREQASRFMQRKKGHSNFDLSEPEFLIGVMDRHKDWCVIVCLIGGGQEINTGEAGLGEWLCALKKIFPDWDVHASSLLGQSDYTIDADARRMLEDIRIQKHSDLHLAVSMRSFRAETLNRFVSLLLDGESEKAKKAYLALGGRYPIFITRNLAQAKEWLRNTARGSERYGLVASSGAVRLRPEGINVKATLEAKDWFLNDSDDVRSSYYLEEAATEFDIQGLELDWVCLAWDADLRWINGKWQMFNFRGNKWQNVKTEERKNYLINAYRVLLTRARQGMVIYVPLGDIRDHTRPPSFYDGICRMLLASGVPTLPQQA